MDAARQRWSPSGVGGTMASTKWLIYHCGMRVAHC